MLVGRDGLGAALEAFEHAAIELIEERLGIEVLIDSALVLGCSAWEAAVMLLDATGAAHAITLHDRDPSARETWARQTLGSPRGLPYLAPHAALPPGTRIVHTGIGGVGFASLPVPDGPAPSFLAEK